MNDVKIQIEKTGKTYRATARGYDGMAIREIGDTFYFEGKKGSWMEEVGANGEATETSDSEGVSTKKTNKK